MRISDWSSDVCSSDLSGHVRSYALFGDVQFRLTERLMFTVGFRYDHETNSLGIDQTARFAGAYPDPRAFGSTGSPLYRAVVAINPGVAGILAQASGSAAATARSFDAVLRSAEHRVGTEWFSQVRQRGERYHLPK